MRGGRPRRHNPGLWLGAALGALARSGRDKLTLCCPTGSPASRAWAEQLVAGATGKTARGLVPDRRRAVGAAGLYGKDRLFVHLQLGAARTAWPRRSPLPAIRWSTIATRATPTTWPASSCAGRSPRPPRRTLLDVHPFAEPDTLELEAAARRAVPPPPASRPEPLSPAAPDFAARLGTRLAAARGRRWVALTRLDARARHAASGRSARSAPPSASASASRPRSAFGAAALHATGQLHARRSAHR